MTAPPDRPAVVAVRDYLEAHRGQMLGLLADLVRRGTSSNEAQPTDVRGALASVLRTLGFRVCVLPGPTSGLGPLYARPADRSTGQPVQLLLGHVASPRAADAPEGPAFLVDGTVAKGAGVFDMKAGLAQLVFALAALRATNMSCPVAPVVLLSPTGTLAPPSVRRPLSRLSRCADRVLRVGPALGPDGRVLTSRMGTGEFAVRIEGESAHAGLDPEGGASAIRELSHVVRRLHNLSDTEAGVEVGVHTIGGGTRANVVADKSVARAEVRVATAKQADRVETAIRSLSATVPGTSLAIEGGMECPPLERPDGSFPLWTRAQDAADRLNIALPEGRAGTASDANLTGPYAPTLDGLGAVGGVQGGREFCVLDRMTERSALLALLLAGPSLP